MTRVLAIALAVALAALAAQTYRVQGLQRAAAETNEALALAQARVERLARETDATSVAVIFDAATAYQRGIDDAQTASDRDAAALRSGALRLRHEWAACETGRLADGAAAARELGEAVERRDALARAVVRVGAACDAKERALITAYEGVRRIINEARP